MNKSKKIQSFVTIDLDIRLTSDDEKVKTEAISLLINRCKKIVEDKQMFIVFMSAYDTDPRHLGTIPQAKKVYLTAIKECGILGLMDELLIRKIKPQCKELTEKSIQDSLLIAIGKVVKQLEDTDMLFEIPQSDIIELKKESKLKAIELYFNKNK